MNQLSLRSSNLVKKQEFTHQQQQQEQHEDADSSALVICKSCGGVSPREISSEYWEALHRETREFLPLQHQDAESSAFLPKYIINQGYFSRFFKMVQKLGKGATGAVYLCKHYLNGVFLGTYALKIVPVGNDSRWLEKKLEEVRLLENLRHENVIAYKHTWIEVFQPSAFVLPVPCLFILMEYADAGNLDDFVQSHFSPASTTSLLSFSHSRIPMHSSGKSYLLQVKELALQICRGIQHLHEMKIIHHDLKPQNILLKKDTTNGICALISDFGECEFTHQVGRRIRTGATGTLEYMAPELLKTDVQGKYLSHYSTSSDIWSFGMILYNLCYGNLPFPGDDDDCEFLSKEIVNLQAEAIEFPCFSTMKPFNCIIQKCLQQNPHSRPTIEQVLNEISSITSVSDDNDGNVTAGSGKAKFLSSKGILLAFLLVFVAGKLACGSIKDVLFGLFFLILFLAQK